MRTTLMPSWLYMLSSHKWTKHENEQSEKDFRTGYTTGTYTQDKFNTQGVSTPTNTRKCDNKCKYICMKQQIKGTCEKCEGDATKAPYH